jgi:hypothetical protein
LWRLASLAVLLAAAPGAMGSEYINEDARIEGKEIHSFQDGADQVSVVLGDFRLTLGKHVVTGRDAVLWIRTQPSAGGLPLNDVEAYVEGEAKVIEPDGGSTSDKSMFVTLHFRGRLMANGIMFDRPLKDFPLYDKAGIARRNAHEAAVAAQIAPSAAPPLIVTTQPSPRQGFEVARPARPPVTAVSAEPKPPRRVEPVEFHADAFSSQEVGQGVTKRRVTVARGHVYLSQGNPDSDQFLEMRAEGAVVFSQRKAAGAAKEDVVPWSPKVKGIETPGGEEGVSGVFLQGDVVIARGNRYFRGPSAYYDFTTHKALMVDPVFRTVQEERNIPIFVRASEARILSDREVLFRNARVTSSDFYTPQFDIAAKELYLKNTTPYDEKGVRTAEQSWLSEMKDATFDVAGLPVLWWPESHSDITQETSPLRRASVGNMSTMGFGGETEWHLFRLLGLVPPEGVKATLELDWYARGPFAGIDLTYDRESYYGYSKIYGILDQKQEDDFGHENKNIPAPEDRGRLLERHKQFLSNDWELQFELSYICDRNYMEEFFPDEYFAGKEQETLLYAKQQRDSWALTGLLQYRLNRFQDQTESAPELGFHLIGQSLADDKLTAFSDSKAGIKRYRLPNYVEDGEDSDWMARLDTRNEINWPVHLGPVNVVPYATGRASYWSDKQQAGDTGFNTATNAPYLIAENGADSRILGQAGVRANMDFWRVYPDVQSRAWDLNGMKHVVTPEIVSFLGGSSANPDDLFPMDPDIEQHVQGLSGVAAGVTQKLQTKRGTGENQSTVDWMRLTVLAGFFDGAENNHPSDGRFFFDRPENSIPRNFVNYDYAWNISDSTVFLADGNYDTNSRRLARWDLGVAVQRDPRLRYYLGVRRIEDLNSDVITAGTTYKINSQYSVSFLEQFDTEFNGGQNLATSVTVLRKFERWYLGGTFVIDHRTNDLGLYLTVWPEGVPEVRLGSGRNSVLPDSDLN